MIHIDRSYIRCDKCGERHTPGSLEECVEVLQQDRRALIEAASTIQISLRARVKALEETLRSLADVVENDGYVPTCHSVYEDARDLLAGEGE